MTYKNNNSDNLRCEFEALVKDIREDVLRKYNYSCVNCNSVDSLQIDHIIPLSLGGTNDVSNLQVLCKSCNCSKGGRRMQKGENCEPSTLLKYKMPNSLIEAALKRAKEENRSLSNLIITALKKYLGS